MVRVKRLRGKEIGSDDGEEEAFSAMLSDDIMLQIFDRLSTRNLLSFVALVCRRWSRLCQSQVRDLTPPVTSTKKKLAKKYFMPYVAKHASTIQTIHLSNFMGLRLDSPDIENVILQLPQLRNLNLSCSADSLNSLVKTFPSHMLALSVEVSYRFPESTTVCSEFLTDLQRQCPALRVLRVNLFMFHPVNMQLHVALQKLSLLTTLDIFESGLEWCDVDTIFKGCKSLSSFFLVSHRLIARNDVVGSLPPSLTALRLFTEPNRSVIFDRFQTCSLFRTSGNQLQVLYAQTSFASNWQIVNLSCQNLKVLDLSVVKCLNGLTQCEERALCELPSALKLLERVCVPAATDRILARFGCDSPQLLEFRLQAVGSGKQAFIVTDVGVRNLVEGCEKLEVLSLQSCHKMTSSSTRAIAFHCRMLKVLHLNDCKSLDDNGIALLFPRLSKTLRLLDVNGCSISISTLKCVQVQSDIRILAIQPVLWKKCQKWIREIKGARPELCVKAGAPYLWDGFYDAPHLSSLWNGD